MGQSFTFTTTKVGEHREGVAKIALLKFRGTTKCQTISLRFFFCSTKHMNDFAPASEENIDFARITFLFRCVRYRCTECIKMRVILLLFFFFNYLIQEKIWGLGQELTTRTEKKSLSFIFGGASDGIGRTAAATVRDD